jgi:hypothetical protein
MSAYLTNDRSSSGIHHLGECLVAQEDFFWLTRMFFWWNVPSDPHPIKSIRSTLSREKFKRNEGSTIRIRASQISVSDQMMERISQEIRKNKSGKINPE